MGDKQDQWTSTTDITMKCVTTLMMSVGMAGFFHAAQARISVVGTTEEYDSNGQNMGIMSPSGTRRGDLLVLFTHRTDDLLPIELGDGWRRVAECFKDENKNDCSVEDDCDETDKKDGYTYCTRFYQSNSEETGGGTNNLSNDSNRRTGKDLAQVAYIKEADEDDKDKKHTFSMAGKKPAWMTLTTLRGACVNTRHAVRSWASVGRDNSKDSIFPSVRARKGDMLLLSMSFDDKIKNKKDWGPPRAWTCSDSCPRATRQPFFMAASYQRNPRAV